VITLRPILILLSFAGVFGCATNSHSSADTDKPPTTYIPGELNGQTLYDLLTAELASNQQNYHYSLAKYLKQAALTNDAGIAKRAVYLARHLKDQKSLTEAIQIWMSAAPQDAEPQQIFANILITQGKYTRAMPYFNRALAMGENKVLLLLSSQVENMNETELTAYVQLLASPVKGSSLDSERLVTLGILQAKLKKHEQALISFNSALSISADLPTALLEKAETLRSLKRYLESLKSIDILLKNASENLQYNALKIQLLFLLKRDRQALSSIDTLIASKPKETAFHNYLALTALDFNQLEKSKFIFQSLLAKQPNNTTPHYYLGIIAERNNLFPLAIQHYLQVTNGKITLQAHTLAIALHQSATDKKAVVQIANDFIEQKNSDQVSYVLMLADWLNKFDFNTDAIALLNKQLLLKPDNTDYLYSRAMYLEPLDFNAAERDFKKVLRITPDNAAVLNAFGYTLTVHTSRYAEALTLIEKALELSPKDPATIDSMGWVLYKLKRYDEAVEYLSAAYLLYNDPEVASHLIAALASIKAFDRAQKLFDEISGSHPNNKFVEQARKSLEKQQ